MDRFVASMDQDDVPARMDWSRRWEEFQQAPRDVILSEPFPSPAPLRVQVRCTVFEPPAGLLDADGGRGWDDLARLVLGPAEESSWRALGGPKRRREWLLGRVAAKDAIRLGLAATGGPPAAPAEIEIGADSWGRPIAGGDHLARIDVALALSLSHTEGIAMAMTAGPGWGIGIDVERLGRRRGDYAEAAFTPAEMALLGTAPSPGRALRLWCAKEAVAKALGRGLLGNPLNLEARGVDA